jgi:hypothetical protein
VQTGYPSYSYRRVFTGRRAAGIKGTGPAVKTLVVILLAILLQGCSADLFARTSAEQVEPGTVLFSDDFSNPPSGWGIWSRDGAVVEYHNSGLRIKVQEPRYDFWSVAGKSFGDVQIEVDATRIGGPEDNNFGIICRYVNRDNFYLLVISSDGYYGIAKLKDGLHSMIGAEQLQYSGAVINRQGSNLLRADCIGPSLRLYANDQLLMDVQDDDFSTGDVGVLAGSYNLPGVDILFDNFLVKKPAD